ncbi:7276_t:CDS:2 [Paraglomus occultum]|uniref:7276_t:CDS:1 n=1 Tax=Paraglomus occultum TaxID=144539 RepID=A0A9N9F1G1_9GLOM|nr:7276_t:CDS:2 [Paraglomus occultum]
MQRKTCIIPRYPKRDSNTLYSRKPDSYTITLDKRPLKVPGGSLLVIPKNRRALAYLVAGEWESQNALLKHHSLPLTSLVARAIVAFEKDSDEKKDAVERLLKYLDTDSICFRHNHPQTLVDLQRQHWDPLIDWIQSHYSVRINTTEGIFKHPHPSETYEKLSNIVSKFDSLKLAAFERAAMLSKSFIIGLGLVERRLSVEEAVQAAQVEVNAQIMGWGEVEDAHDVDREDIRRQLGSVVVALINENVQ